MTDYVSDLDSWRFGFKIIRINGFSSHPRVVVDDLKKQGAKLVIARVSTDDISTINTMENMGFEYKDTQLKYRLILGNMDQRELKTEKNVKIRIATENDVEEMMAIAKESFYDHGHYFADPKLDRKKCIEVYMDWAKRCCLDKAFADIVFLAENEKEVMGFLSYKIFHENGSAFSRTGLGAMRKKYRGSGVYTEILKHAFNWAIQSNLEWEEHFVLVTNIPINNLFSKLGFKIFGSFMTFHYWIDSESEMKMKKHIGFKWDSQFFGFKVAKLIPENILPIELEEVLHSLKKDLFRFIYLFLDPADEVFNRSAIKNKGILVDEKVTYSIKLTGDFSKNLNDNIIEYKVHDEQLDDQIINLALQAGAYSRFKKDPNLSMDQFIQLYSAWAKNSLNGIMADHVFVYKIDKCIKGFITLRTENRVGEICLIGVDKKERGNRIGSKLITSAKSFFYDNDIVEIKVVTQKENVLACRFYEKSGFSINKIQNVYHFWL